MSQDQVRTLLRGGHVPKQSKSQHSPAQLAHRERGTMNKTESAYAAELERQRNAGMIRSFAFEAVKIRLADNTYYTPDFLVVAADNYAELHDVKGRKGSRYWCEEDAKVKIKVAAEHFPARVKIVWPNADGTWSEEVF